MEFSLELLFVGLILLTLVTIFGYLGYSGLFHSLAVSTLEPPTGALTLAYKTQVGPYKDAGWLFTESFCLLPHRQQLGIYYDDPEGVPAAQLRCAVGPVLATRGEQPDPAEVEKVEKEGFSIIPLASPSYVVSTSFPFTTTLSIYLAIYKAYPALRDYISERRLCAYPALELYTDAAIVFMMPLSRQDEFFVQEFQEDDVSVATDVSAATDPGEAIEKGEVAVGDEEREKQSSSDCEDEEAFEEVNEKEVEARRRRSIDITHDRD